MVQQMENARCICFLVKMSALMRTVQNNSGIHAHVKLLNFTE